jgi:hypothetical protein
MSSERCFDTVYQVWTYFGGSLNSVFSKVSRIPQTKQLNITIAIGQHLQKSTVLALKFVCSERLSDKQNEFYDDS